MALIIRYIFDVLIPKPVSARFSRIIFLIKNQSRVFRGGDARGRLLGSVDNTRLYFFVQIPKEV